MTDHDDGTRGRRFPRATDGYATEAVDTYLQDLETKLRELEGARDDLEAEVTRLGKELADARSRFPEIEQLHGRLEEVREEYQRRTHALELLTAAATREIAERLGASRSTGEGGPEPLRGAWDQPESRPPSDRLQGPG